jgi:hypothetical protein
LLATEDALAGGNDFTTAPRPQHVTGGSEVDGCAWPISVAVTGGGSLCSGTLVHPEVVVYAAHCGDQNKQIRFGESSTASAYTRNVSRCLVNPEYLGTTNQSVDWAFCVLQEPITEIPVTPPLFGCETDVLEEGVEVAIVGFGDGGVDGASGTKRWGLTEINTVYGNTAAIGGDGTSTCSGDSGSSSYVKLTDGTWHSFSITSTGNGSCDGASGVHSLIEGAVPWIEAESEIDITPCHDLDGTWNPTPNCGGFFAGGETPHGTWPDWCEGTPIGDASSTCGAAYVGGADEDGPEVTITSPTASEMVDSGTPVTIVLDAADPGAGVKHAWIEIDGAMQPVFETYPPYDFEDVPFPDGIYEIVGFAEDWEGNVTASEPVTFGVGMEVPDASGGDGSGSDGSTDGVGDGGTSGGGTSAGGGGEGGSGSGGGCRLSGSAPAGSVALLLLGLLYDRRRRTF